MLTVARVTTALRIGLTALNVVGAITSGVNAIDHAYAAYQYYGEGDYWSSLSHASLAAAYGGLAVLSALGIKSSLAFKLPTIPPLLNARLLSNTGYLWSRLVINPAFSTYVANVAPAFSGTLGIGLAYATSGHKLAWELRNSSGQIKTRGSETSGGTGSSTPTFQEQAASHTERKMLDRLNNTNVQEGDIVTMRGELPPCAPGRGPLGNHTGCLPTMMKWAKDKAVTMFYKAGEKIWRINKDGSALTPDGNVLRIPGN